MITGHTPIGPADANISVNLHFRSDSADEISSPALADAISMIETGSFQTIDSGLTDLIVTFRSDVEMPEPFPLGLVAMGVLGLGLMSRRRFASP